MQRDVQSSVQRIAADAQGLAGQARRAIGMLVGRHRLAQVLFYGEDGQLKPDAVEWFDRLARENFVDGSAFDPDPREHARREGRRELALEIMASVRLDTKRLNHFRQVARENERE